MANVVPDHVNIKWKHPQSEKLIMMHVVVSQSERNTMELQGQNEKVQCIK